MQMLRETILELGYVLPGNILNANAFLNHQLNTQLLVQIGRAFAGHFNRLGVTKHHRRSFRPVQVALGLVPPDELEVAQLLPGFDPISDQP